MSVKFSEVLTGWLAQLGYTHCFFVAGGNSMHLLDAARKRMSCVPFVHEVAAGIAAEYFNESEGEGRAYVLVTAGPGLTNLITAMAGAYLESRELLVVGGQVKSVDLKDATIRQRGIQEVDGVALAAPVCVAAARLEGPVAHEQVVDLVERGRTPRKGPVFIEVCLDAQGAPVDEQASVLPPRAAGSRPAGDQQGDLDAAAGRIAALMRESQRPVWLLGGGVGRECARTVVPRLRPLGIPLMTTWNGMDRIGADDPLYFGRPNTWGQRSANVLVQQADVVVALGTRLGLQQTGFNWQEFAPRATVVQVDIDEGELAKGHPRVDIPLRADADALLTRLAAADYPPYDEWLSFCRKVRDRLGLSDANATPVAPYLSPYDVMLRLSELCRDDDVVVPCSSGGAFTVAMQAFNQKRGQLVITNKGLASMGYGLAGAVGAALAHPTRRVVLFEGDGGFCQNLQEVATVAVNDLNLKLFVFANDGYASIRMTQRNYFGGEYLGCDTRTGLGFPDWAKLFDAYGVESQLLAPDFANAPSFLAAFSGPSPVAFVVPVDPEQTYFPKISSRVTPDGGMESNPLHLMTPPLPDAVAAEVFAWL